MILNNLSKLSVVTDFEYRYGLVLSRIFPELTDRNIIIYSNESNDGWIKKWDKYESSPYISNHVVNEIMRNEDVYLKCDFNREEEYAIIAHELGHILNGIRGEKSEDKLIEEMNADQMAARIGLSEQMKSAIQKMIDLNINPENNTQMQERINRL